MRLTINYGPRYVTVRQAEYSIDAYMTLKRDNTWDLQVTSAGIGHHPADHAIRRGAALIQVAGYAQAIQASLPAREITEDDAETLGFNDDGQRKVRI